MLFRKNNGILLRRQIMRRENNRRNIGVVRLSTSGGTKTYPYRHRAHGGARGVWATAALYRLIASAPSCGKPRLRSKTRHQRSTRCDNNRAPR